MKFSRGMIISIIAIPLICAVIIALAYLWFYMNMLLPYEEFLLKEKGTLVLFDALNDEVWRALPPLPSGSSVKSKWSVGIDSPSYTHGRWLTIEISTTETASSIVKYYDSFLRSNGWHQNQNLQAFDDVFYYRGTSCIELTPPHGYDTTRYRIYIWHDFQNQDFSPKIPDLNMLIRFELGATEIAQCP
jgi:hypothetical protein